jgi:hypothetical protein
MQLRITGQAQISAELICGSNNIIAAELRASARNGSTHTLTQECSPVQPTALKSSGFYIEQCRSL